MAGKTREELKNEITDLCEQAGCNEKISAIHRTQYVDRRWNPHPPPDFRNWWSRHSEAPHIDAVRAFNCQVYRDEYIEVKRIGAA